MIILEKIFLKSSIKIKNLRKFFSQEWDRRGDPTSIKKILMGHSLKGDVDLMHYNCQSEEVLKLSAGINLKVKFKTNIWKLTILEQSSYLNIFCYHTAKIIKEIFTLFFYI